MSRARKPTSSSTVDRPQILGSRADRNPVCWILPLTRSTAASSMPRDGRVGEGGKPVAKKKAAKNKKRYAPFRRPALSALRSGRAVPARAMFNRPLLGLGEYAALGY